MMITDLVDSGIKKTGILLQIPFDVVLYKNRMKSLVMCPCEEPGFIVDYLFYCSGPFFYTTLGTQTIPFSNVYNSNSWQTWV